MKAKARVGALSGMLAMAAMAAWAGPAAPPSKPNQFPFEITSNKPFVPVRVNGSEPQWFVLDTGCRGSSILARECAQRLGLSRGPESETHMGAGQGVNVALSSAGPVTLGVAGDTLQAPSLYVIPFDHVVPYEGRAIDGLLGEDYMQRHVVELDYAHQTIRVFDPGSYRYSGETPPIPITFDRGLVVAQAEMTSPGRPPLPCRVVIDTGVRTTVVWYHPFTHDHDLLGAQAHTIVGTIGGGAGGETRGDVGRLDSLRIGAVTFRSPTAVFSRDTSGVFAGREEDGIVGGELLRRCKVTFDYPHHRLMLEPGSNASERFDYDMSGMFLVAHGPDFGQKTVQSVADGTPASEAGVRKDDEIVAVDHQPTRAMKLDEVRDLFRRDGVTHRLDLKRGADSLSVSITTRRLV
jgi:hypothetical protein